MNNKVPDIEQWMHDWRRMHRPYHALRAVAFPRDLKNKTPNIEEWSRDWRRVQRPYHALRAVGFPVVLLLGAWFTALILGR